jgi:TatD DNase family protein
MGFICWAEADHHHRCRHKELAEGMSYYISIPGTITLKNERQIQDVAARIRSCKMLLETDAPFLTPLTHGSQRNGPSFLLHTAQKVAESRSISCEEVPQETSHNASQLFNLPSPT